MLPICPKRVGSCGLLTVKKHTVCRKLASQIMEPNVRQGVCENSRPEHRYPPSVGTQAQQPTLVPDKGGARCLC